MQFCSRTHRPPSLKYPSGISEDAVLEHPASLVRKKGPRCTASVVTRIAVRRRGDGSLRSDGNRGDPSRRRGLLTARAARVDADSAEEPEPWTSAVWPAAARHRSPAPFPGAHTY